MAAKKSSSQERETFKQFAIVHEFPFGLMLHAAIEGMGQKSNRVKL